MKILPQIKEEQRKMFKFAHNIKKDYCPKCHKRREFIKHSGEKMCKTCGHQEKD